MSTTQTNTASEISEDEQRVRALVSDAQRTLGLPQKPRYHQPCNNCGMCCLMQLCPAAEAILSEDHRGPCPFLLRDASDPAQVKAVCRLVQNERERGMLPMLRTLLGVGTGCTMGDEDTTLETLEGNDAALSEMYRPHIDAMITESARENGGIAPSIKELALQRL